MQKHFIVGSLVTLLIGAPAIPAQADSVHTELKQQSPDNGENHADRASGRLQG